MRQCLRCSQAGFILPLVLILVQIMLLYSISAALLNQLMMKRNADMLRSREQVKSALLLLHEFVSFNVMNELPCRMPLMRVGEIKAHSPDWWLKYGCRIENTSHLYYVVVESLGNDPCGLISEVQQGYTDIASYYRLTMAGISESGRSVDILMQVTMAVPLNQWYQCHSSPHRVTAGIQMHRQL